MNRNVLPASCRQHRARDTGGSFAPVAILALALSLGVQADSLRLQVQNGYLPQIPVLVRVEILRPDGSKNRDIWDAEAMLSVDEPGVTLSTNRITLRNGLGSALVTFAGGGDFNLISTVNGLQATRPLNSLASAPVTTFAGTLSGTSTTWSGVIRVTNDVTVPSGHTLTIQSNSLVLVTGVASGTTAPDLFVNGTLQSLGTETHPITITSSDQGLRWGQIRHNNAQPSVYRYTTITMAGRATGEGHTGTGPVIRPNNSKISFESCTISDLADASGQPGKVMYSPGGQSIGSDITFSDCLLARARMGPEIQETALLCTNTWIMEMRGPDDSDGIYLHDQKAGQQLLLTDCVIAGGDDDGIDTLGSTIRVLQTIIRDWTNPNEDAKGISVFHGETDLQRCLIVNCYVGVSAKSSGPLAKVVIDRNTIIGITSAVSAAYKDNARVGNIDYRVTNSIVRAPESVHTDFGTTNFNIGYCNIALSDPWPGTGNITADPQFVNGAPNNYHLMPDSPCIDAGDPAGSSDPDGTRADIGAFPFELAALVPVIISPPRSQMAIWGASVTFEVDAVGMLPLSREWRFNGRTVIDQTNHMLAVIADPAYAGEYTVVVRNTAGSVTSSPPAVLTVLIPPNITRQPSSQTVVETCDATFSLEATGTPPLHYQWRAGGVEIEGATNSTLVVTNVRPAQAGSAYSVVVSNVAGSMTSQEVVVTISPDTTPPTITGQPQGQTVAPGATVMFTVAAASSLCRDLFSYQWRFKGAAIPGATNSSLTVANAQAADTGDYVVEVRNIQGNSVSSDPARLALFGPPELLSPQMLAAGAFGFMLRGTSNQTYQVQATTNFIDWENLFTLINTNGQTTLEDTNAAAAPSRFYRVRSTQ